MSQALFKMFYMNYYFFLRIRQVLLWTWLSTEEGNEALNLLKSTCLLKEEFYEYLKSNL